MEKVQGVNNPHDRFKTGQQILDEQEAVRRHLLSADEHIKNRSKKHDAKKTE